GRRARRGDRPRLDQPGADRRGRPLQGRLGAHAAGQRAAAPGAQPREPRRGAGGAQRPRHPGPPAHEAHGRGPDRPPRPPPPRRHPPAQAGHDRRAGRAAQPHEPAARPGLARVPRHDRRPARPRRVAVAHRPGHADGRLRALAPRVGADAPARPRHAGARRPRPRPRAHGLGHPGGGRRAAPAAGRAGRGPRRRGPLRPHRAAPPHRRPDPRAPGARPVSAPVTRLQHGRVTLALHHLSDGEGRPLLLLHGLGERTPDAVPERLAGWPGPVVGLDLTGHGASDVPAGGGYYCEALMGDVDAALAHLGPCTVRGRGLGAYVALLIAGARPTLVRGAVLADGPGLAGGGPNPPAPAVVTSLGPPPPVPTPDPWAMLELSPAVRP